MAYDYKYVQGLRRRRVKRPFTFGKMIHSMIEAELCGKSPFKVLREIEKEQGPMFAAEVEMYGEILDDARFIMRDYFDFYEDDPLEAIAIKSKNQEGKVTKRKAEHNFEIELFPGVIWNGVIDAIVREGRLTWTVDHKTFNRADNEDSRWRNIQGASYTRAVEIMGWANIDGMLWNMIRSKPPARPKLLKDGSVSKAIIDSLPSVLKAELKRHGADPSEYTSLFEQLKSNRTTYFMRHRTPTSKSVVDLMFTDFKETAQDIVDNHGKRTARNVGRHCSWCDYEPLCRATLQGSDVDFVKAKEYRLSESASKAVEPDVEADD